MAKTIEIIPFQKNSGSKLIPWMIALMVYLATISLAFTVALQRLNDSWQQGFENGFIIELKSDSTQESLSSLEKQNIVLDVLSNIPGIKSSNVIAVPKNDHNVTSLSTLIQVDTYPKAQLDLTHLEKELSQLVHGVVIRNQSFLKNTLSKISQNLYSIAMIFLTLITATTMFTIAFVTHSGLVIHQSTIDVLRLLGAKDFFIAKEFQKHAFKLSFRGCLFAIFISTLTLWSLHHIHFEFEPTLLSKTFDWTEMWGIIILAPLFMLCMTLLSAKMTVLLALSKR